MATNLVFDISKAEIWNTETEQYDDLGVTKGGATFSQTVNTMDITDDQDSDALASIILEAPKTFKLNLLNASPTNLALAFGGTAASDTVSIPSLVTGKTKKIKVTTKAVNGYKYEIEIKNAFITCESEITLSNADAATLALTIEVLASDDDKPVTIKQVAG